MSEANTMTQAALRKYLVGVLRYVGAKQPQKALVSALRPLISHVQRAPKPEKKYGAEAGEKPEKRGAGYVTIKLPDQACEDLKPEHEGKDAWFIVRVDRAVLDELEERLKSKIIRPEGIIQ